MTAIRNARLLLLFEAATFIVASAIHGLRAFAGAQVFATFGVLVGLFTIAVGVGPRTVLDVAYHVLILAVLGGGLALALRERARLG